MEMLKIGNVILVSSTPHVIDRYGVQEFVVISPGSNCEAIISESKCNLLLSSISIALSNSGW